MTAQHASFASTLIALIARSERLEALPRTGWIPCGVQHPESIASHSFMVTLIALWLADHIEGHAINPEAVMRIALVHDLGESMLTDLPKPVKTFIGKNFVKQAEERAIHLMLEHNPTWCSSYMEYQKQERIEARIVKAADRIQMLAKACQYKAQHRGDTQRFFDTNLACEEDFGFPLVRQIMTLLHAHHKAGSWPYQDFD